MPVAVGVIADSYNKPATGGGLPVMTGLQLWLDADNASTFSYASGDRVSEWRDASPGGHHFTRLYETCEPRRGSTLLNGRKTVYFDGIGAVDGGGYSEAAWPGAPIDNLTIIGLAYVYTTAGNTRPWFEHGSIGITHCGGTSQYGALHQYVAWLGVAPDARPNWVLQGYIRDAGVVQQRKDGADIGGTSTSVPNAPDGVCKLGGDGWSQQVRCEVAELVVYNRVLTPAEITQVESYLCTKWGTP